MYETRLERILSEGPPWEETYRPALEQSSFAAHALRRRAGGRALSLATGSLRAVWATLIVAIVVGGFLWFRQQPAVFVGSTPSPTAAAPSDTAASDTSPDLLSRVREAGTLRLAIRPDFPQASINGLEGFDVDVATELGRRLELSPHPVQASASEIFSGGGPDPWDVGMPSTILGPDATARFVASSAYYYWPSWLVVPAAAMAASPADLADATICVTSGSPGESWLAGRLDPAVEHTPSPPSTHVTRAEATDWACLDALTRGEVDALVTASLADTDLAARPSFRTVGGPLFIEPRTIVAARTGPDPSSLVAAVDNALEAMRSDGTLADLSRNRFGGRDLTITPSTP